MDQFHPNFKIKLKNLLLIKLFAIHLSEPFLKRNILSNIIALINLTQLLNIKLSYRYL